MSDPTFALPSDPRRAVAHRGSGPLRIVIIGGGPGGYEAAIVGRRAGADVTLIEEQGIGGSAVLTDVVPSKTLVATADVLELTGRSGGLGVRDPQGRAFLPDSLPTIDLGVVNRRLQDLAVRQSHDIRAGIEASGVRVIDGRGILRSPGRVRVEPRDGSAEELDADMVLLAVGATPRDLPEAGADGERILNWKQLYELEALPEHLIVVGSGVTGAEFASAYHALGAHVTLVSSRDVVLPGADRDAADLIQRVFVERGITVRSRTRAAAARNTGDGVEVTLSDGSVLSGSHVLMAVGAVPATAGLGLDVAGVATTDRGHIQVDRVSRTSALGVYAAGDCTGVYPLASVAATQARIAMQHALGDAVTPLLTRHISSAIFTSPEVATVGYAEEEARAEGLEIEVSTRSLATNARAKMQGIDEGFVKIIARPGSGVVIGGVVVSPRASELIHPIALAVTQRLSVDDLAGTSTVYPALSGSIAETARRLHVADRPF